MKKSSPWRGSYKNVIRYSSSSTYSRGKTTSKLDENVYFKSQEYHPLYLCLVNYQWITNIIEFKLEFFLFVKLGCFSQLVLEGWINFLFFICCILSVWIYTNEWINPMLLNKLICSRTPLWKYQYVIWLEKPHLIMLDDFKQVIFDRSRIIF